FTRDKLGDFDTELFKEWFQAFAFNAGMTLHVENLYGTNNHHMIEATFKALARALREAIEIDPRKADAIPSTKGALKRDVSGHRRLRVGQSSLGSSGFAASRG